MNFKNKIDLLDWDETTQSISNKTEHQVIQALTKEFLDVNDFMALISPAATPYIEQMAQRSELLLNNALGKPFSFTFLFI